MKLSTHITPVCIEQAIQAIEKAFSLAITVHDCRGFLRDEKGHRLLPGRHYHPHAYCRFGRRSVPGWNANCSQDCHFLADTTAGRTQQPYLKRCWKAVHELVAPVHVEDVHILTVFAGVFRREGDEPHFHNEKQRDLYQSLAVLDEAHMEQVSGVLMLLGQGMVHYINQYHEISEAPHGRRDEIRNFLHYNAHRAVGLKDLASHLHLSHSRTSHLVKELLGESFQDLLVRERMLRARVLLLSTSQSLEEIGEAVGICNAFYFNRVFKRFFGTPPGRFRRANQNVNDGEWRSPTDDQGVEQRLGI